MVFKSYNIHEIIHYIDQWIIWQFGAFLKAENFVRNFNFKKVVVVKT